MLESGAGRGRKVKDHLLLELLLGDGFLHFLVAIGDVSCGEPRTTAAGDFSKDSPVRRNNRDKRSLPPPSSAKRRPGDQEFFSITCRHTPT